MESSFYTVSLMVSLGLQLGLVVCMEIGYRVGKRRIARSGEGLPTGVGASEAAIFGLMGLLIAFTFSGATSRFEARRHLLTEEANAIGTAYLRLDLLPASAQPEVRRLMRAYVDARIDGGRGGEDVRLQNAIWAAAQASCRQPEAAAAACQLALPALNEMIDITTTRAVATRNHPPPTIYVMLLLISLASALLIGYSMAANERRSWIHIVLMSVSLAVAIYVILDLEFPRLGLIRVDSADWVLVETRRAMGP